MAGKAWGGHPPESAHVRLALQGRGARQDRWGRWEEGSRKGEQELKKETFM